MTGLASELSQWDWTRFQAVIFDLDGTLYDQKLLRKKMLRELLLHYAFRPHRLQELKVISTFRRLREEHFEREEGCLNEAQYRWTSEKLGVSDDLVRQVVDEWILRKPLRHLLECRPPGLADLFDRLRRKKIRIGVFSDYPVTEKLAALNLQADASACAVDDCVNRLKPDTTGLRHIMQRLAVSPETTLHIGDRQDRDAICAERVGCASLIIPAHHARKAGPAASYDLLFPGEKQ